MGTGFSLTYGSSRAELSFPTLGHKGARMYLIGLFGLSLYWHLQTVLQRTTSLERTFRAIINHKLGAAKNLLWYIIAPYCVHCGFCKEPNGIHNMILFVREVAITIRASNSIIYSLLTTLYSILTTLEMPVVSQ